MMYNVHLIPDQCTVFIRSGLGAATDVVQVGSTLLNVYSYFCETLVSLPTWFMV